LRPRVLSNFAPRRDFICLSYASYRNPKDSPPFSFRACSWRRSFSMDGIIYLVGLIVIIMAILSLFGLR
jgi:hypothetical protein